jgi:UDP-N-acetylglucosamine 4,6-dehydratase/5-epimerase
MLQGKRVLVTGGTGSFGNIIVQKLVAKKPKEIIVFSRDEKKQWDMAQKYPDITYVIGDVRDKQRLKESLRGVDIVYQAAALKQVPACELNPYEAVKTNIIGVRNLIEAAIENNVERVVAVSTDKAVKPVNVMGMTKAIQERLITTANGSGTIFSCVRYGNVLGSRGSVVPLFRDLIDAGKNVEVMDKRMTRFILTLDEAIELVFKATTDAQGGETFVRKSPALRIIDLAEVMTAGTKSKVVVTKPRPGEKIHEILVSEDEMRRSKEEKDHFIISSHMNSKFSNPSDAEFSSDKTRMFGKDEIKELLRREKWLSS